LHMVQLMPLHLLPHLNPDWCLPFWYQLSQVDLEKKPLNSCSSNSSSCCCISQTIAAVAGRRRGVVVSGVRRVNEVNARRARLVLEWVTGVFGPVYHLGM